MNCLCSGKPSSLSRKFTVLLVHVVPSTPVSALRHSSAFAIQLVQDFFKKYTRINPERVIELSDRFWNLEVDSRLEIAFEGKPIGFEVPSYSVYNHQSEYGIGVFELEARVTARYIPPGAEYKDLEIERPDFLSYLNDSDDIGPRRFSYTAQPTTESHYKIPKSRRR
jgi:hypothetical protein